MSRLHAQSSDLALWEWNLLLLWLGSWGVELQTPPASCYWAHLVPPPGFSAQLKRISRLGKVDVLCAGTAVWLFSLLLVGVVSFRPSWFSCSINKASREEERMIFFCFVQCACTFTQEESGSLTFLHNRFAFNGSLKTIVKNKVIAKLTVLALFLNMLIFFSISDLLSFP